MTSTPSHLRNQILNDICPGMNPVRVSLRRHSSGHQEAVPTRLNKSSTMPTTCGHQMQPPPQLWPASQSSQWKAKKWRQSPQPTEVVGHVDIEETITTEAELQEVANRDQGLGPRPEDPGTLTTHPAKPATSIGSSGRAPGTAKIVIAAHGDFHSPRPKHNRNIIVEAEIVE